MSRHRVAVIPGDDAAPEAVLPVVELLDGLDLGLEWLWPQVGEAAERAFGSPFPDLSREQIDAADATLFGATSGRSTRALLYLRWGRQTYANLRPCRYLPGAPSVLARPEGIDFVIVRENLEDLYVGAEGPVASLAPLRLTGFTARRPVHELGEGGFSLKVITVDGTRRIAHAAFRLARQRRERGHAGRVTSASKHNMLPGTDGLFRKVVSEVAGEYPDVDFEHYIVDDFARRLVAEPHDLDVVLLPNLYGDILSDAAAGLVGGLGLAPSGCYGDDYAYFESAHGTAPDLAGRHCINPTATLLSAGMMLRYLGHVAAADRLAAAVEATYADGGTLTPDVGGLASSEEFCRAVAARIA